MNVNGSKIKAMASLLRSVATTTAASAIPIAIAFSSSSSSSPTNPNPQSLNFSRPSPRGLGLARSFASSPMTTVPASDSNLSQVYWKSFRLLRYPLSKFSFLIFLIWYAGGWSHASAPCKSFSLSYLDFESIDRIQLMRTYVVCLNMSLLLLLLLDWVYGEYEVWGLC